MESNTYQKDCMRTIVGMKRNSVSPLLEMGIEGMNGEAGEAMELLKKHKWQGHELDEVHLAKELGDVLYYVAVAAAGLGLTLDEIMLLNIAKRKERYPDTFKAERSLHRKDGDI